MYLGQTQTGLVVNIVLNLHKNQVTRTPGFVLDRSNARTPLHRIAHFDRLHPGQTPASPHAPGQGHGRQKPTAQGMAIGAQFALRMGRQKIQPMAQGWELCATLHIAQWSVEGGHPAAQWGGTDVIV